MTFRSLLSSGVLAAFVLGGVSLAAASGDAPDPFLWLESVDGARAMAWVKEQNARTLDVLERAPQFAGFYREALAIGESKDRIPAPNLIDGRVYNFWQDATHVRGIWRYTTPADYATDHPAWTTALDLDALAKNESKNWFWQSADCDSPSGTRCLISLSEGGEDASTVREFDLRTNRFVEGGFDVPRGKQTDAWLDDDTILVSREWIPGELTTSGYPYDVRKLARGQALSTASEVFRGESSDVSVSPERFSDGPARHVMLIDRGVSFFESKRFVLPAGGGTPLPLALPLKAEVNALVDGRLAVTVRQNWTIGGTTIPQGDLVSIDAAKIEAGAADLAPTVIYAPGPREALSEVAATRDRLIVATLDDVRGRADVYAPASGSSWTHRRLALPDDSTVAIATANDRGSQAMFFVTSFLTPTTLWEADADGTALASIKALPPMFDASNETVDQYDAVSKDGTRVPYFVVHPKTMRLDGKNPTIQYGYGGFGVSLTPTYGGVLGKLWLDRGGVYVLANIRGGGEFGPAWHDAALTVHRQRAYDDFAAVSRDLIARKITSTPYLGIEGGSNGGLLMGVEMTQNPTLYNAVDIQVPLLDMLRFEKIEAGASWVGEYGSVSDPEQRAFLASISPYANLKRGVKYPEPFVWTTTKDDRVGPQHARKFAAKMASFGDPYLYYEVIEGGHAAGADIKERAHTSALEYTYFTMKLDH